MTAEGKDPRCVLVRSFRECRHSSYSRFEYAIPSFTLWVMVPGSSTDISEDWEKDFDLDMTEEEVQMALSKVDASGEVSGSGWPQGSIPSGPRA